jgi:hypothetical protein
MNENYHALESEVSQSIDVIGHTATWISIENIKDAIERLKYRNAFFKVGGKIPYKEDDYGF